MFLIILKQWGVRIYIALYSNLGFMKGFHICYMFYPNDSTGQVLSSLLHISKFRWKSLKLYNKAFFLKNNCMHTEIQQSHPDLARANHWLLLPPTVPRWWRNTVDLGRTDSYKKLNKVEMSCSWLTLRSEFQCSRTHGIKQGFILSM